MRIAIDCRTILNPSGKESAGVGHYTDGIVRALLGSGSAHDFVLFFEAQTPNAVIDRVLGTDRRARVVFFSDKRLPFVRSHWLSARTMKAARPDVLFATAGQLPLLWNGPAVVTEHDFAIYRHPEWFPDSRFGRAFSMSLVVPSSLKKAVRIIAVSDSTRRDILDLFPSVSPDKIRVVHEAVDVPLEIPPFTRALRERLDLLADYFFTVGTLEPRKNFLLAARAFDLFLDELPSRIHTTRLAMAGKRGWGFDDLIDETELINRNWEETGYCSVVNELGYVTNEEKWMLLKNALALVYPSRYEGFGLPVLEAMSLGVPVIAARNSSIPEVAGDAALYVSEDDPDEAAEAMKKLVLNADLRAELGAKGRERAKQFSWERAARETLAVLQEAARV